MEVTNEDEKAHILRKCKEIVCLIVLQGFYRFTLPAHVRRILTSIDVAAHGSYSTNLTGIPRFLVYIITMCVACVNTS